MGGGRKMIVRIPFDGLPGVRLNITHCVRGLWRLRVSETLT